MNNIILFVAINVLIICLVVMGMGAVNLMLEHFPEFLKYGKRKNGMRWSR